MAQQNHQIEEVKTTLEIEEHLDLHKKGWVAQRIGLIFIFLLVASAALGLFGDGLLSTVKIARTDSTIEFDRFFRFEARMPINVEVSNAKRDVIVSFANDYLSDVRIESIVPEPVGNKIDNGRVEYTFKLQERGKIVFYLVPQSVGTIEGDLIVNESTYQLSHFIYP